jgi:membrane fusion protein (multidrug efflux system)
MLDQRKRVVFILVILIILLIGLFVWHEIHKQLLTRATKALTNRPIVVEMSTVQGQVWHPQIQAVGTVLAEQGVNIESQVIGVVQNIYFQSGDFVDEGTKLVQLDPTVFFATAEQSKAKYEVAKADYGRQLLLYKRHVISTASLQSAYGTLLAAKAQWDADAANLQHTIIVAPFSGNLGLRRINLGQVLQTTDFIVSLQSIDPILVDFSLPEVYLHRIAKGDVVEMTTSAYPGQVFTGKISALNSTLNPDTRTLDIRAELPNKNKLLMPGMFAQVNVIVPVKDTVLTVPQMAIQYSPFGDTVFIVQNHRAVERYVTLGEQRGALVAVIGGLAEGETVVSVGANKLQNGTEVITKSELEAQLKASAETRVAQESQSKKHAFLTAKPSPGKN